MKPTRRFLSQTLFIVFLILYRLVVISFHQNSKTFRKLELRGQKLLEICKKIEMLLCSTSCKRTKLALINSTRRLFVVIKILYLHAVDSTRNLLLNKSLLSGLVPENT